MTTSRVHPERTRLLLAGPQQPGEYRLEFLASDTEGSATHRATLPLTIVPAPVAGGVSVEPNLSTSGWTQGNLTVTFSENLGTLLALIDSVEVVGPSQDGQPGPRAVFDKKTGMSLDATARTVTLAARPGLSFGAGSTLHLHFLHGLPSWTLPAS